MVDVKSFAAKLRPVIVTNPNPDTGMLFWWSSVMTGESYVNFIRRVPTRAVTVIVGDFCGPCNVPTLSNEPMSEAVAQITEDAVVQAVVAHRPWLPSGTPRPN
jgi:hypothetical protein